MVRLTEFVVRLALTAAVIGLMLVPAGACLCAHEETGAPEDHQPGCPDVRQIDRPSPAVVATADGTHAGTVAVADAPMPVGPPRAVAAVAHGPPRGRPLYLTLRTLLI